MFLFWNRGLSKRVAELSVDCLERHHLESVWYILLMMMMMIVAMVTGLLGYNGRYMLWLGSLSHLQEMLQIFFTEILALVELQYILVSSNTLHLRLDMLEGRHIQINCLLLFCVRHLLQSWSFHFCNVWLCNQLLPYLVVGATTKVLHDILVIRFGLHYAARYSLSEINIAPCRSLQKRTGRRLRLRLSRAFFPQLRVRWNLDPLLGPPSSKLIAWQGW